MSNVSAVERSRARVGPPGKEEDGPVLADEHLQEVD
eukprot:CAMPEP_0179928990 /NCGR_PEP_ID=MMETSP0983-20121128/9171_1 /TAXON_ID=483367 /ORGANISM="non described non described, Strain CCMP 2436" /LENGTH=35 /DNA_ID= /DNA_START= /DNA_END= /DNA_ORIENTATION=